MARTLEEGGVGEEVGAAAAPPVYSGRGPLTDAIDRAVDIVERLTMWAAAGAVMVMMLISAASVAGRELLGAGIPDDVVMQGLLMVATIALPLAYIHRRDGHISVTITTNWLPPRAIALLRILGAVTGFVFFGIVGLAVLREIGPDYTSGAVYDGVYELPAWPMKVVFVIGLAAFLLRILLSALVSAIDFRRGEAPGSENQGTGRFMDPVTLGVVVIAATFVLLLVRVPIAFALGIGSTVGIFAYFVIAQGMSLDDALTPTFALVGTTPYGFINSYTLATIPLFVFMGHLAFEAGFTGDIYRAARLWLSRVPGGLAMASVVGCGGFSAITGSSVACAAAMGRIAIPEMRRYDYSRALAAGSVAAGGTLGSLIPPSILFILYGIFTEQSIEKLFIAGIIPGLLSLLGYLVVIFIWARLRPAAAPPLAERIPLRDRLGALLSCWAILLIFLVVIGGIYVGVFTPSESAGVGAFATLILGFLLGRLTWKATFAALKESTFQTSMIFAIAIGGKIFTSFIALTQIPLEFSELIAQSGLSLWMILLAIVFLYLILGMFLDPIGILILTLPVTVPIIESYNLSLIWYGVVVIKMLEVGLITPPIGLNVFVIKSVAGENVRLETIFKGIIAFLISDAVVVVLLVAFPILSVFLPNNM